MFNISVDKKLLKILLPLTACIIFILILLTLFIKNNDINKLNKISKNIVHVNASLKFIEKDGVFDSLSASELLQDKKSSLNDLINNLNELKLNNSNLEPLKKDLSNYINLNLNLYDCSLDILNNKNPENFETSYKKLVDNEKAILISTQNFSKTKLSISFPKEANTFFANLNKYVNNLYKLTREKDIKDEQKRDFILNMNNIYDSFSNLKQDFKPALIKIREDNRDLSVLLYDIKDKKSSFSDIKNKSYSVSIPIGGESCYETLEEMLNSYNSYINSLEQSVKNEIALLNESSSKKNIDDIYEDTFNKYSDFLDYLEAFETAINLYKN
ncbi:hypothetical protein [Clostridium uliginosum]|uniref:Uncharacterized protein n=1 Tax=Clostridium uliginosum TaxID=119641 RepID=A0A1I1MJJ5_9CLOT|nr:hypothetical protein [Clostridium uliginosum]SFC82813.1 hypothetical protein SAMN05421842_110101 [Clostridium uliginosum]